MNNDTYALIVAAGRGQRFGDTIPKQYCKLSKERSVLYHAVSIFINHPLVTGVQVVIHKNDVDLYEDAIENLPVLPFVIGGVTRQESVLHGLYALSKYNPKKVLIHDAARPFVKNSLIDRVIDGLIKEKAVIPITPIYDTVKEVQGNYVKNTLDRTKLKKSQTPQGFDFDMIYTLHKKFEKESLSDDAQLCEKANVPVLYVDGSDDNIKITKQNDLKNMNKMDIRVGNGFDVHPIKPGNSVKLFGCTVPCSFSLEGHSDADVGLHSITDAILGVIGDGDIGTHFPSSDDKWKDADSTHFLIYALKLLENLRGEINHIDITFIGEEPKISSYREEIRQKLSGLLKIDQNRISLKATTTDQLGFLGRKEGVAVFSTVTIFFNKFAY
ncbi:MAG: 2-C-methyl-D-erythritol 4-phosphate cytidylyltransferase [Alphaproteobacteria bacterium]